MSNKMTTRKSMANVLLESAIHSSPTSSSPLRRKSVPPQKFINISALSVNDDQAERLARRHEITDTSTPVTSESRNDKRRSLGLSCLVHMPASKMAEHISQCIKLGTENKINSKNAFSLEMIDFMTYMIKKKDANMSNLQVASTSLDISTKIYGFRVDGVHMDILKMIGGFEKQDKNTERQSSNEEIDCQNGAENNQEEQQQEKKKRKRNKQRIFNTVEALKMHVQTEKPSLITMEKDLQTTDMLYQVMLPNHANSKFYPHPYNDILVDTINTKDMQNKDTVCNIPKIEDFSEMEICPPLFYFDFHNWNADDEVDEDKPEQSNEDRFQFDLNASLPHEDEHTSTSMNYFDIEMTEEENVNECARRPNQVENIVDFCNVLTSTVPSKVSEYSFMHKNLNVHWAGPSYWKATNFKKGLSHTGIDQVICQPQARKKKEIQLCYDDEIIKSVSAKFLLSQTTKLQVRTAKIEWNEEILTLPPDKNHNIMQLNKLYLHSIIFKHPENKDDTNDTFANNDMENYNCTHEFQQNEEDDIINNDIRPESDGTVGTQIAFTGDNLVAVPKLTNKLSITYCVRAKKIDMRQLKCSIWKCLQSKDDENIQEALTKKATPKDADNKMNGTKHFNNIYKKLPSILSKNNVEVLSFPISFVSLLHIANEKTLKINSSSDLADLIIQQD